MEYRKNLQFYDGYQKTYQEEKNRNNQLKTLMVKTQDTFEMEKTLRNKLNMTKPNESLVVISLPTPTPLIPSPTPPPVYTQWYTTFFEKAP